MEKIIVEPRSVRGLGNIVDTKVTSEFGEFKSNMGSYSSTAYGTVFTMKNMPLIGSALELTYNKIVSGVETIRITATLKTTNDDSEYTPMSGASLLCYFDSNSYTATTNSNGVATFDLPVTKEGKNTFKVVWTGTHNEVAGCMKLGSFYNGIIESIGMYAPDNAVEKDDTIGLVGIITPPFDGEEIQFLVYTTLFDFSGIGSGQIANDGTGGDTWGWVYDWTYGTEADGVFFMSSIYSRLRSIGATRYVWANLPGTTASTTSQVYDYHSQHLEVSLDVVSISTGGSAYLEITTSGYGTEEYKRISKQLTTNTSVKVVIENDSYNYYVDDELIETSAFVTRKSLRVGMRAATDSYIDFKNFKIKGY